MFRDCRRSAGRPGQAAAPALSARPPLGDVELAAPRQPLGVPARGGGRHPDGRAAGSNTKMAGNPTIITVSKVLNKVAAPPDWSARQYLTMEISG
ncbi:hypothetical protein KL86PLE_90128 [uncultured Pleomorphomonas sp.]|uniref:Uncharacterized protein n=1 Tax=uncultured Pleomorphomonas sp. TaxID=442121 RepID=A0A212LMX4_9HYPH|nr:hypothetical protein KL86PLE_90128 [uncultured Pleomorphomonas sp.]